MEFTTVIPVVGCLVTVAIIGFLAYLAYNRLLIYLTRIGRLKTLTKVQKRLERISGLTKNCYEVGTEHLKLNEHVFSEDGREQTSWEGAQFELIKALKRVRTKILWAIRIETRSVASDLSALTRIKILIERQFATCKGCPARQRESGQFVCLLAQSNSQAGAPQQDFHTQQQATATMDSEGGIRL